MPPVVSKLAGMCGQAHVIILLVSFIGYAVGIGIVWGNLTAKVDDLKEDILRERAHQLQWNADERQQDQIHRDKMDHLQMQIIELLKDLKK